MVTIGTGLESSGLAIAAAERFPEVYAAVGIHPNEATGFGDSDYVELEQLARHPRCVAIGETGLDYYREHAPHEDQKRAFKRADRDRARGRKPLVIHTREADDDTLSDARRARHGSEGDPPLLLDERAHRRVPRHTRTGGSRSRATSPTRRTSRCARRRSRSRPSGCWSRPTLRICRRSRCVASRTRRPTSSRPHRRSRSSAVSATTTSTRRWRRPRPPCSVGEARAELPVDRNILDVIERLAALSDEDVVLEVGGGPGVLSQRLAQRAAFVHVVELDRSLEANLRGRARALRQRRAAHGRRARPRSRGASTRRPPRWSPTSRMASRRP